MKIGGEGGIRKVARRQAQGPGSGFFTHTLQRKVLSRLHRDKTFRAERIGRCSNLVHARIEPMEKEFS
jgi:hypothetical protein